MNKKQIIMPFAILAILLLLFGCSNSANAPIEVQSISENEGDTINDELNDSSVIVSAEAEKTNGISENEEKDSQTTPQEELLNLFATNIVNVEIWDCTVDNVISCMGKEGYSESDKDNGSHVLQYDNAKYGDYDGTYSFLFQEGKLYGIEYYITKDVDSAYENIEEQFLSQYGEPGYKNAYGNVWFEGDTSIGLSKFHFLDNARTTISIYDTRVTKNLSEDHEAKAESGFEEDVPVVTSFSKDDTVTSDSCEFTLFGYAIANRIEPERFKGSYYHYYEAREGNTFIDTKFMIKCLSSKEVFQANVLKAVKIIYDEKYEYLCTPVTVDKDGDFEGSTFFNIINPLETLEYHMLAEVPNEIKDSGKSLVCQVEVDGTIFECKLR